MLVDVSGIGVLIRGDAEIITEAGYIYESDRNAGAFKALYLSRYELCQRQAPAADAEQHNIFRAVIALCDLMRDPCQRTHHIRFGHYFGS